MRGRWPHLRLSTPKPWRSCHQSLRMCSSRQSGDKQRPLSWRLSWRAQQAAAEA
jgi:hypothetical protein